LIVYNLGYSFWLVWRLARAV